MNEIILTNRLVLRELSMKDIDDFYKMEKDPLVRKYIPNLRNSTYSECKESLKKHIEKYKDGTSIQTWALTLNDSKEFIGIAGFRYMNKLGKVEIGIRMMPNYWGNGYATETGKALVDYGFKVLGLKEIIAMAVPENERSMKALKSIGLIFDRYDWFAGSRVAFFKATKLNK